MNAPPGGVRETAQAAIRVFGTHLDLGTPHPKRPHCRVALHVPDVPFSAVSRHDQLPDAEPDEICPLKLQLPRSGTVPLKLSTPEFGTLKLTSNSGATRIPFVIVNVRGMRKAVAATGRDAVNVNVPTIVEPPLKGLSSKNRAICPFAGIVVELASKLAPSSSVKKHENVTAWELGFAMARPVRTAPWTSVYILPLVTGGDAGTAVSVTRIPSCRSPKIARPEGTEVPSWEVRRAYPTLAPSGAPDVVLTPPPAVDQREAG